MSNSNHNIFDVRCKQNATNTSVITAHLERQPQTTRKMQTTLSADRTTR